MDFVAEAILPAYVRELERTLDDCLCRFPSGRGRSMLARLRRRLARSEAPARFASLHRLVALAEAEGWLTAEEAIVIDRLAYRVGFYARRGTPVRPNA